MLPVLTLAAALALAAAPDHVTDLRDEARALVLVQQTLQWYTKTQGETSVQAETYAGHAPLFSRGFGGTGDPGSEVTEPLG